MTNPVFGIMDRTTTGTLAVGAVSSPFWYHTLEGVSYISELLIPILGALWLFVQISTFLSTKFQKQTKELEVRERNVEKRELRQDAKDEV